MKILLTLILTTILFGSACVTVQIPNGSNSSPPSPSPTRTPQPSTLATVNGRTISAENSDEEILKAFGIDRATATSRVAKGPDGHSTSYTSGEQMVSITRSAVSGVYIMAEGPVSGEWWLGGGL